MPEHGSERKAAESQHQGLCATCSAFPYAATFQPYPHFKAKTRDEAIKLALHRLYEQMGQFYRLDLRLQETVDKPTEWKLEVIDENGRPNRQVEAHYPHRLMPCAKASP